MRHALYRCATTICIKYHFKTLRLLLVSYYNDQMGVPVVKASDLPKAQTRPNHVALFLIHFSFLGYLRIARQPIDQKIFISVVLRTFPFWFEKSFCFELVYFFVPLVRIQGCGNRFNRILSKVSLAFAGFRFHPRLHKSLASSVTRLGDFLHFG